MKTTLPILAAATLLLAGCQTGPSSFLPQENTKYSIENTGKFVLMDQATLAAVTCTGLQEHTGGDGRLEVVANVQNHGSRRIEVQVRCVFKDASGFSTGDGTAWQLLALSEGATEALRFASRNSLARQYTVEVRQPR
jgi:uncharacterized protein YcfL